MNTLTEIQEWYLSQCNDEWEHGYGIKIDTLDNPGWAIDINLRDTNLEGFAFTPSEKGVGSDSEDCGNDWWTTKVEDQKFIGRCGPEHLETVLRIFLDWTKTKVEPAG